MFRLVLSRVSSGTRFKRFWVPSLDRILDLSDSRGSPGKVDPSLGGQQVTNLIGHVRIGGTNKTTKSSRLEAADAALLAHLPSPAPEGLHFLDVGCSDGTTSIDTVERIERMVGVPVVAYLMDRYIWIRRARRMLIVEYTGAEDQLVMVRCGYIALAPAPESFLLAPLTNGMVRTYLGLTGFRGGMRQTARFPLLSPRALARSNLHIREGSVLTPHQELAGRMHVVRSSNLLHFDYFSETQLRSALSILTGYVRPGGLLVLSRNHEEHGGEIERGTVWRRVDDALVAVVDFGGGSELKGLINPTNVPATA